MKIIKHTEVRENVLNLTIEKVFIEKEEFTIIVQVEKLNYLIKKVNFVMIKDDLTIDFDEIDSSSLKFELMNLLSDYVVNL
jgi:hypothetical protein